MSFSKFGTDVKTDVKRKREAYVAMSKARVNGPLVGNGPNTVSESTVSNTELSEFLALTEFRGESSVSSSRPTIRVIKRTHRVFAELTEFAATLSEAL